jgi:hypothetical protein
MAAVNRPDVAEYGAVFLTARASTNLQDCQRLRSYRPSGSGPESLVGVTGAGLCAVRQYEVVSKGGSASVDTQNRQLIDTSKPAIN